MYSGEIKNIILSIKSKPVGCDNIGRHIIVAPCNLSYSKLSINFSRYCTLRSLWRKAFIQPLPKNRSHFRPIPIIHFLCKVLEVSVEFIIYCLTLFTATLISLFQSGFKVGHSTVSDLFKVPDKMIRRGKDETKVTHALLIDLYNAFNTLSREVILSNISYLMVSREVLEWFSSCLQGHQQWLVSETFCRVAVTLQLATLKAVYYVLFCSLFLLISL